MIVGSYCNSVFFLNNNTYTHCLFVLLLYKTRLLCLLCAEIFVYFVQSVNFVVCKYIAIWHTLGLKSHSEE